MQSAKGFTPATSLTTMDKFDELANAEQPIVQESDVAGRVELYLPAINHTVVMDEEVFMSVFAQGMRIITDEHVGEFD